MAPEPTVGGGGGRRRRCPSRAWLACGLAAPAALLWATDLRWLWLPRQLRLASSPKGENATSPATADVGGRWRDAGRGGGYDASGDALENALYDRVAGLVVEHATCEGKERLLEILARAGKDDLSVDDCSRLPHWSEVSDLYGEQPIIAGLDTCEAYRSHLAANGLEPDPRVAGLFNTGTNAFAESLMLNFKLKDILEYTAPGGKHTNVKDKETDTARTTGVLPIVLIRDPFRWQISMCKSPYKATWKKGVEGHCPNLVPNEEEMTMNAYSKIRTFEVTIDREYDEKYDSLADMWSEYYLAYLHADFPRLIIRFEDTLYHAEEVMRRVTECIGAPMKAPFQYHLDASKSHGNPADFGTALAAYGQAAGREGGMSELDKEYALMALDETMMQTFHYPQLPATSRENIPRTPSEVSQTIDGIMSQHPDCSGKQKLLETVVKAGMHETLDNAMLCKELPTWNEVSSLYGDQPIIHGLDSCQRYRDKVAVANRAGLNIRPDPRVGGLFDTGTNALVESLMINYKMRPKLDYNLPNGKHTNLSFKRWAERAIAGNETFEFPVVLVRDPYRWMNSMCKASYKAHWLPGAAGHCPNLVPTEIERQASWKYRKIETYEVQVKFPRNDPEVYPSLADMWSEWYAQWVSTSIPSLLIRFEDTLFHAEEVMKTVLECIGEPLSKPFAYQLNAAKTHGQSADFLTALAKYGRAEGRSGGMTPEDKEYALKALDPALLEMFHYKHVPLSDADEEASR